MVGSAPFFEYIVEHTRKTLPLCCGTVEDTGKVTEILIQYKADMSIERHAKDLEYVLADAFPEYDGPILLIGHSMGCQVNLEAIVLYKIEYWPSFTCWVRWGCAEHLGGVDFAPYVFVCT